MTGEERMRMNVEWDCWQDVCREFKGAVGDVNEKKYNALVLAIRKWGEHLHALRNTQATHVTLGVRGDADAAYGATQD